uniref:Uncharacterized protein n=1 Tax=Denticeps clupeoides TaxID=299321 RepID=A0AAY4A0U9_9TELE
MAFFRSGAPPDSFSPGVWLPGSLWPSGSGRVRCRLQASPGNDPPHQRGRGRPPPAQRCLSLSRSQRDNTQTRRHGNGLCRMATASRSHGDSWCGPHTTEEEKEGMFTQCNIKIDNKKQMRHMEHNI